MQFLVKSIFKLLRTWEHRHSKQNWLIDLLLKEPLLEPKFYKLDIHKSHIYLSSFCHLFLLEWIELLASSNAVDSTYKNCYLYRIAKNFLRIIPASTFKEKAMNVNSLGCFNWTFLFCHISKFKWKNKLVDRNLSLRTSRILLKNTC